MKKLAIIHNFLGGFLNVAFLFFSTIIFLPYYFEFISNDTLQIKYKDNMNLDNLINFSKQNDK